MELLLYWRIIKKRLWLIVLLAVVAGASATYFGQQQVPLYSSSTTLFLNSGVGSPLLPYQTVASVQSLAQTYSEFMRTRSFAGLVAGELDPPLPEGQILGALSSQWVQDTQFFKILARHPDPGTAQALANGAAQVIMAENIARQQAQQQQIEAQRDPARILERQRLTELQDSLQGELQYLDDRISDLQAQITELEGRPPSAENDQRILDLRQEAMQYQAMRVEVFGSLAQTQSALAANNGTSSLATDTAVVVDPAPLPLAPEPRNTLQYILLAVAAALGLGVGLAFALEYLDWTIKTPEELDAVYGQGSLGVIGVVPARNGKMGPQQVVTLTDPRSAAAEAFRALRTNLRFASPEGPLRSLLVTSAGPGEGKTMTAANLAVALAQAGSRVILVDADLRRPRQHRVFEVPSQPGLTDLVVDGDHEGGLAPYLRATAVENLRLLPSGALPLNPAELLGSERAAAVMAQLQAEADVVIYDSPPAATVTDAVLLSPRVDAVLQVVQAGGPRRDVVLRAKGLLDQVGARILGPVLNQVEPGDAGYYSYYYYYGSDGHDGKKRLPWGRRKHRRHAHAREEAGE